MAIQESASRYRGTIMVRSYRYILAFFLTFAVVSPALASDYTDCTVISRSSSEITFQYRPAPLSWAETAEGGSYPRIANTALNATEGQIPVSGRIVYVALPPGSEAVDAALISTGAVTRISPPSANRPSPLTATVSIPPAPERLVVEGIYTVRGVRVARLILHPAIVAAADGSVDLADEMTVQMRYDRAAPSTSSTVDPGDPFGPVLSEILINPEDGFAWRDTREHFAAAADLSPFTGSSNWVSIRTRGDGIHTISADALSLAGVNIASVNPAQIRLFSGPGRQLSTKISDPPPPFSEHAILWDGDDDAVMESGERFLFWADGLNRWDVDSLGSLIDVVHRYDRDNAYWLALSHDNQDTPRRIATLSSAPQTGAPDLFTGTERARHEEENLLRIAADGFIHSYYTKYWRNQKRSVITFFNSRNAEPGTPAKIDMGSWVGGSRPPRLYINGDLLLPSSVQDVQGEDNSSLSTFTLPLFDPNADYELDFDSSESYTDYHFYLDFYTLEYQRRLDLAQGALKFSAPDTTLDANFVIANAATARVWDLTDPFQPVAISDAEVDGSTLRFSATLTKGERRVFYVFTESAYRVPRSATPTPIVNLHTPAGGADYLALGPRAFAQTMNDFLTYRAGTDNLLTRFIATEDVYHSFSLGIQDPLAIRRFLRHTHTSWPGDMPAYCLLVGDGSFDYLNHTGANSVNYVPPYIVDDEPSVSDESFIYFSDRSVLDAEGNTGDNPIPDMLIGRWPVKSTGEIVAITQKIEGYESPASLGQWRSRVMMVGDDEFGERPGSVQEDLHIEGADDIANVHIPPRFDVQKIYLTEFPFDNPSCYNADAVGCRKPGAKEAVIAGLNAGALVFDYLGHGNADVLAHERILERQTDLPRLVNTQTPAAFLTFTCSIGFFDDPESEGMSEDLLRMPQGGAIAVVSATRTVPAGPSIELNEEVFDLLFRRGVTGIAAALYTGKLIRQYAFNNCGLPPCPRTSDRGYVLFGDPAMKLGEPTLRVNFESLTPASLSALTITQVQGSIVDTAGNTQTDFSGTLFVTVRDVPRSRVYPLDAARSIDYQLAGGTLYRGQVAVTNGQFSFSFIVPKDIAYGQIGAMIMGHAVGAQFMANGAIDSLRLAGSPATISDTSGPAVRLETDKGEVIEDGFHLPENTTISVLIEDPSGINLTGSAGHLLEVFADDAETALADLTDGFVYDPGAPDRGQATFNIGGLALGPHRMSVKAWDNANNSTALEFDVEIIAAESDVGFALTEFLNFPNPFTDATTFYFRATRAIHDARIRLFTLAGRMIWETSAVDGMTTWDGRDIDGDAVANGVYLAQIEATGEVLSEGGRFVDKKAYREMKVVVSR